MNLFTCMQTNSSCYKGTTTGKPVGILFHDTGAGNPNIKRYVQPSNDDPNKAELLKKIGKNEYNNSWNQVAVDAGLNAWIGKLADGSIATCQSMPWNYRPWGCGSGVHGSCNGSKNVKNSPFWIQFEICDDGYKSKDYFDKVYKEAVEFAAYLCKMFGFDPLGSVQYNGVVVPVILCHKDAYNLGLGSNHGDVLTWWNKYGKTMQDTRNDVAALLKEQEKPQPPQKTETQIAEEWAVENGLIKGYPNGDFGWSDNMTRAQFVTLLYRYNKMIDGI